MTALYKDGTITLVNGSPVITGNDTAWAVSLIVGGTVFVEVDGGNPLPILPDDGGTANLHPITDTQMTSAINWTGPSGAFNYALVRDMSYTRQQSINAEKLGDLLSQLDNPLLAALSSIEGLQDHLILLTGPSTATIIPRSSLVEGVDYDVAVNALADLATYNGEVKDFSVLVADAGSGRAALFIKRSNTDGDWVNPAYITGLKGEPGTDGEDGRPGPFTTIQMGDTTTLNPGQPATVTLTPVSPGVVRLDFGLPRGTNGTGTGDVVGPAGAVNDSIAIFDGATGKLLKVGGVAGDAAYKNTGTSAGTVAAGDDGRFSNNGKLNVEDQTLTGGARVTSKDLGTISTGTLTLDPGDRPLQHYTNNGAHTLSPGTNTGSFMLDITNGASAGAITVTGWTKVAGDAFTTTSGNKFRLHCSVGNGGSLLIVQALQ